MTINEIKQEIYSVPIPTNWREGNLFLIWDGKTLQKAYLLVLVKPINK